MDKIRHQTLMLTCIPAVILAIMFIMLLPLVIVSADCQQTGQARGIINPSQIMDPVDPAEINLVCRVVAAEARGECLTGQMAVTQVIADRAELRGMTLTEVVQQPEQFAEPHEGEIGDLTKEAVHKVIVDGERVFDGYVTHFASNRPYWARGMTLIGEIAAHKFYREEQKSVR